MPDRERLPDNPDLGLHHEISGRERLDAILESRGMTDAQAVAAASQLFAENQATFPHLVVTKVMTSHTPFGPNDVEYREYVGPFRDRRAAETWAAEAFAENARVTWEVARIDTPEMHTRSVEQIRRIAGDD